MQKRGSSLNIYIINLDKDRERRAFQKEQMQNLQLEYEIISATTTDDICTLYKKHRDDWQRPLREVELACYFSHQKLWQRVLEEQKPALILEDDAIVCSELPKILEACSTLKGVDHISLESVGRKKLLGRKPISIPIDGFKLSPLFIDRNGAGGYILYPSGAKKLLEHEAKNGIALADAQITSCFKLQSYQLEPACIIQMDQCHKYGLKSPIDVNSNITGKQKCTIPQEKYITFKRKRIIHQIKLALRELQYIFRAKRRKIELKRK